MEFNDRRPKGDRYLVLTQHRSGERIVTKKKGFDVFEDAQEHVSANTPDTDGKMQPNIDQAAIDRVKTHEYEAGGRWNGNRHAAILLHKQMGSRYR